LFDLEKDPLELNNLAYNPEFKEKLNQLQTKLSAWTTSQGDDLKPHRDPYPLANPLPDIESLRKSTSPNSKK
jgi:hypothetical protein